jgi:lipoprotein-releasing system permease protein
VRKFELKIAWQHLLSGHGQTELNIGAIAVGVVLVVFLSSLINGLQVGLIDDVVGAIPHVTVEAATPGAKPLWQVMDQDLNAKSVTKLERMSSERRKLQQWQQTAEAIKQLPEVEAVAPTVEGSGIVGRGAKKLGVEIFGVNPNDEIKVTAMHNRAVEGDFMKIDQQNAAIGIRMADELGVQLGDRIRVASDEGVIQTFRIACIFDVGISHTNKSVVYVGLPAAQGLFKLGKDITTINVRSKKLFQANEIAEQIRAFTPLKVTSWMEGNQAFLDSLKAQNSSALIVQAMTLLASAFGVASVMIVFVVQKSRDIGILKSMGATPNQILRIFMLEGVGIGLAGAVVGSAIGTALCFMVQHWVIPNQTFGGKPATIVPMDWDIIYVFAASGVAIVMGLLSSLIPAKRAANLHPVEAIRHD